MSQLPERSDGLRQIKGDAHWRRKNDAMRILLAEDDHSLGQALADGLRLLGYAVDWITDGSRAAAALNDSDYTIAILDRDPPRSSGLAVVAGLRRRQAAPPVLLLTAGDGQPGHEAGLDTGVAGCLIKPIHLDELAACLRALLQRADGQPDPAIRLGDLEVVPATRSATLRREALVLTGLEYALLETLVRHPGRAHSREQLEEALYSRNREVAGATVEVHIHRLRRKLGPGWIRTLRGIGYAIRPPGRKDV
ncbi:two component transcriptional regulator, winged helix family protein [Rhodanobacter sp. 115]|nr:two component transcriptional regulator, winged helix family protein [Rhodanobacter sp. 115]